MDSENRIYVEKLVWQLCCDAAEYGHIAAKRPELALDYIEDVERAIEALQLARRMLGVKETK